MQIRPPATPQEIADAANAATVAFACRNPMLSADDVRACGRGADGTLGVFADDGTLMTRCSLRTYTLLVDGSPAPCMAVGGIATLPEYRNRGCVRALLQHLFAQYRAQGCEWAYLFPFSHAYYRKFQFECVGTRTRATIPIGQFAGKRPAGSLSPIGRDTARAPLQDVYHACVRRHNLAQARTGADWDALFHSDRYQGRCYAYALALHGRTAGYIWFDAQDYPQATMFSPCILRIREMAWDSPEALRELLGLVGTFGAKYKEVVWDVPPDVDVCTLFEEPFDLKVERVAYGMLRVLNVSALLGRLTGSVSGHFTLRVHDPHIAQNNGRFSLTVRDGHTRCEAAGDGPADLEVSAAALAQLAAGVCDLHGALLCRDDVVLHTPSPAAQALFCGGRYF